MQSASQSTNTLSAYLRRALRPYEGQAIAVRFNGGIPVEAQRRIIGRDKRPMYETIPWRPSTLGKIVASSALVPSGDGGKVRLQFRTGRYHYRVDLTPRTA